MTIPEIITAVKTELDRAIALHPPATSLHESYAIILEELDEFWDEVKKKAAARDKHKAYTELIQIAAMAIRAIESNKLH